MLENELHQSLAAIEDQHKSRMSGLQLSLDQSESRITDLESLLHQSESRIKQIGHNSASVEDLRRQLNEAVEEKGNLQTKISRLEALQANSDVCLLHAASALPATSCCICLPRLLLPPV